jgi:hypothetical protein
LIFWKVVELDVSPKNEPLGERERQHLVDGDIHLNVVAALLPGSGPVSRR